MSMENHNSSTSNQEGEEEECLQQREARERLSTLRVEASRRQHTTGGDDDEPPASDPATTTDGDAGADMERIEMEWLESEMRRSTIDRLPKHENPPRDVLKCASRLELIDEPPPSWKSGENSMGAKHTHLQLIRVVVEDLNCKMFVAFVIEFKDDRGQGMGRPIRAGKLAWSRDMGAWSPTNWAWMIATILKRTGWPVTSIGLGYKLQDCPQDDFERRVRQSFVDVTYTDRYGDSLKDFRNLLFIHKDSEDMDKEDDLPYLFDSSIWKVAREVGLDVEDRSLHPALSFKIGPSRGIMVLDKNGKRWASQDGYVTDRLNKAPIDEALTEEDGSRLCAFVWDALSRPEMRGLSPLVLREHAEELLGKSLQNVSRNHNTNAAVSAESTSENSGRRCDHCNAVEGTARDSTTGEIVAKFEHCSCNPEGRPFYCGPDCRQSDWSSHKEFCTAELPKMKKTNGKNGSYSRRRKRNRNAIGR